MTLYCGIDLHSNNIVVSLINDADQLISEKRFDNNLEAIAHHLQQPAPGRGRDSAFPRAVPLES